VTAYVIASALAAGYLAGWSAARLRRPPITTTLADLTPGVDANRAARAELAYTLGPRPGDGDGQ
jgi:ribose/xylose/arabinose/galactoside ABC-type transport system permease subunit